MELEEYSLRDLLSRIVDNRGRTCPTAETGTALIATNCIKDDQLYPVFENVRWVDSETMETWFRGHPEPGDILFVLKGSPGRCCLVPDPINFCIAQDMLAIRADENKVSQMFLFALLRSSIVRNAIDNLHVGTMIPHFKKGDFGKLKFQIPKSRKVQEWIGDQYFILSNKIELNRRMNATLQGLAQALFKSWFVDFDPVIDNALVVGNPIPDELADRAEVRRQALADGTANREAAKPFPAAFQQTESMGWIPEGWELKKFGEIAQNRREGVDPTTLPPETPYVGLEHVDRKTFSLTRWGVAAEVDSQKSHFKREDFLFGKLRPYFHKVCQVNSEGICSTDILVVHPRHGDDAGYVGCQIFEPTFVEYANLRSTGTRMPRASWKDMAKYEIACPPQDLRQAFNVLVKPIREKCSETVGVTKILTNLRDTLLTKLISGELRLPKDGYQQSA